MGLGSRLRGLGDDTIHTNNVISFEATCQCGDDQAVTSSLATGAPGPSRGEIG